jgi:replicative superfamily II helicase
MSAEEYVNKQEEERELQATQLGTRVSQIYLDPLSANIIIEGLIDFGNKKTELDEETKGFILNHLFISNK